MKEIINETRLEIRMRYWLATFREPRWTGWFPLRPNLRYKYIEDNLAPVLESINTRISKSAKEHLEKSGRRCEYKVVKVREFKTEEDL